MRCQPLRLALHPAFVAKKRPGKGSCPAKAHSSLVAWTLATFAAISVATSSAVAQSGAGEPLHVAVRQLVDTYWDARAASQQQAGDTKFDLLMRKNPDWRVLYAQALVQAAQYRTADARETTKSLLKIQPHWRVHRAYAWSALASRDYENGLLALDAAVKALPKPDPAQPDDLDAREAAMDIGRMFAFLEVAVGKLDAASRDRYLNRWQLLLPAKRLAALEKGRELVREQHANLIGKRDRKVKTDTEQATKQREEKLGSIDSQQDGIAKQSDGLRKNVASLRDQLKSELAAVEREDLPLRTAFARLETRAVGMERDLAIVTSDIARIQNQLDFEEDPAVRVVLESELRRLDAIAVRRDSDLLGAERELDIVAARRRTLLLRHRSIQSDLGGQITKSNETIQDLNKLDRRLDAQRQRVLRSSPKETGGARAMATRSKIIATYFSLPLAEERRLILNSLTPASTP